MRNRLDVFQVGWGAGWMYIRLDKEQVGCISGWIECKDCLVNGRLLVESRGSSQPDVCGVHLHLEDRLCRSKQKALIVKHFEGS